MTGSSHLPFCGLVYPPPASSSSPTSTKHFRTPPFFFLFLLLTLAAILTQNVCRSTDAKIYTNQWVIRVNGSEDEARMVASEHNLIYVDKVMDGYYLVMQRRALKRSVRSTPGFNNELSHDQKITWFQQQVAKKRVKRDQSKLKLNDPKWPRMWYLNRGINMDMNVIPAWRRGYTGQGVVISILDDGIEKDHPDLKRNYDPRASYDVNEHDNDPQPRYEPTNENKHGTRCAGEVAAESNNAICGTGIAFNARIGGVRMLDGDVTDAVEAQSLSLNPQYIDIYSASWGPDDDGRTVDGPGPLAWKAFQDGVNKGRGGRGSIFVWASGNGGQSGDNCNCDGYTNIIYTLSISSASENGHVPWYSEACPSALATTYSSGSGDEKQIVTTDLNKSCTEGHTGTSASAPLAAGMCALVLQANPSLTWRDLQHIVVLSAKQANLVADDWHSNAVGRKVSHRFGFGLMDVGAMIDLAENWTTVPQQKKCEISHKSIHHKGSRVNSRLDLTMTTNGCQGEVEEVKYLEHVQIIVTITAQRRGDLEIALTSPGGTRSIMLARRSRDVSTDGFNNWTFMTTHCWGESPVGMWKLEVKNPFGMSNIYRWTLVMYGTDKRPYEHGFSDSAPLRSAAPGRNWHLSQHIQDMHRMYSSPISIQGHMTNRNAGLNSAVRPQHSKPGQRMSKLRHGNQALAEVMSFSSAPCPSTNVSFRDVLILSSLSASLVIITSLLPWGSTQLV